VFLPYHNSQQKPLGFIAYRALLLYRNSQQGKMRFLTVSQQLVRTLLPYHNSQQKLRSSAVSQQLAEVFLLKWRTALHTQGRLYTAT
jgi:hypothetical protein